MTSQLQLYISASQEMDIECELVSKLLAEQIKTIRWRIWRTPLHGILNPDAEALASSQFFVLLLGTDLVAPMGVEYNLARQTGAHILAFRDENHIPSPAADYFVRNMDISWQAFKKREVFILAFERALLTQLINGTPGYGLDLQDIELIGDRLHELETTKLKPQEPRGEAGQGGVILTSPAQD